MFKNLKYKIASLLTIASFIAVPLAIPAMASADIQSNLCQGTNVASDTTSTDCGTSGQGNDNSLITNFLQKIVNIITLVVGVIAVIMIIVGGFKYITSGGESNNVTGAKNTIVYALVGLVIVALAQIIVHFVVNKAVSGN